MNEVELNYKRLFIFGAISGLLWSLLPGYFSELLRSVGQTATVFLAGVLTGMAVSLLLAFPLLWLDWKGLLFGFLALPLSAFLFGVFVSLIQKAVQLWLGPTYRFVEYGFAPVEIGRDYVFAVVSIFPGLVLLPLALVTTALFYLNVIPDRR